MLTLYFKDGTEKTIKRGLLYMCSLVNNSFGVLNDGEYYSNVDYISVR